MTDTGPRRVTGEDVHAKLRELVKGDWSKLENDDPELMAEMRKFLGIADRGAVRDDAVDDGVFSDGNPDD